MSQKKDNRSPITTHVLDTAKGRPAEGIEVILDFFEGGTWKLLAQGVTDSDGRLGDLLEAGFVIKKGMYRLVFKTGSYLSKQNENTFYPEVPIVFEIKKPEEHYHVPLLLSPFGYSTYRGS